MHGSGLQGSEGCGFLHGPSGREVLIGRVLVGDVGVVAAAMGASPQGLSALQQALFNTHTVGL